MSANNTSVNHHRIYIPILIGISLLMIVFVLYPLYTSYVDTRIEMTTLQKTKIEKIDKIQAITKMQALFASSGSSDIKTRVSKYNHGFNTSDIMEATMVNKYTASTPLSPAQINISSITVDPGKKLPSGLSLASISLSLSADTPDQIIDYLTYLTSESKFAYTIDSISLPLDTASLAPDTAGVSLAINLGVYYYE